MNFQAVGAIYTFEMARFFRTLKQSFLSPVLSTSLYFVVFGTAIGSRMEAVDGPPPGPSPRAGVVGYVGAAATKSLFIGLVILGTAYLFVDLDIQHPIAMMCFLLLTCLSFSLLGFIIGIWAGNFEQLNLVPMLVVTPLVFLGGSFYSISMLPPIWQTVTMFNPVVYLISGFRWAFFGQADVAIGVSLGAISLFTLGCMAFIWWIFKTGWRIRS